MSLNRWNARRDANEGPIVQALRAAGADVIRLDVFDLLVLYRGRIFCLDAKLPKTGKATTSQDALVDRGWPLCFVHDPIDALKAIGAVK
jgi:hypothetical protein